MAHDGLAILMMLALFVSSRAESFSTYRGTHHFEAAEDYLEPLGIPMGLPQLSVKYVVNNWGKRVTVEGSASQMRPTDVEAAPLVAWEAQTETKPEVAGTKSKFALVAIGPDEGTGNGPKLLWMGVNCEDDAKSCYQASPYMAPACKPQNANTQASRVIFVLFKQIGLPPSDALVRYLSPRDRNGYDFAGFVQAMASSMQAAQINYFTCSPEMPKMAQPHEMPPPPSATPLGVQWDATKRPKHDEL